MYSKPPHLVFSIFFILSSNATAAETSCYDGTYRTVDGSWGLCSGFKLCEPGNYCEQGMKYPCPGGKYGNANGLRDKKCSGLCPSGYICPEKTSYPFTYKCGLNESLFCPEGSATPTAVSIGYYSIGGTTETRNAQLPCPKGSYCVAGVRLLCPSGSYGENTQLSSAFCTGVCPAGWYCPEGTEDPYQHPCYANPSVYCPKGSARPLQTPEGYFATDPHIAAGGGFAAIDRCPQGTYCLGGVRYNCPAGRYGLITGSFNASCTGPCQVGFYCPAGSALPTQHACGSPAFYCPPMSPAPIPVSVGYYTVGGNFQQFFNESYKSSTRTDQVKCEPGYYCPPDGIKRPCPAGQYGSTGGLTHPTCSGPCQEGYYCPEASISWQQLPCGNSSVFCPIGSAFPQQATVGYYTVGGDRVTMSTERRCEPGFYCVAGVRIQCPAGTWGGVFGLIRSNCSGLCAPGYYCPEGSDSPEEIRCGDPARYCPEGSPHPLDVPAGYFTIGGVESTRYDITIAPRGSYAVAGIVYRCPAGRFGAVAGLKSSSCSGVCAVGFYCPEGSVSAFQTVCGGSDVYCPSRSMAPVPVLPGRYTSDWTEPCGAGYFRNYSYAVDVTLPGGLSEVDTSVALPVCEPCPTNTFKHIRGNSFRLCVPCNNYAFSAPGQAVCSCDVLTGGEPLPPGQALYFNVTANSCTAVSAGLLPHMPDEFLVPNTTTTKYFDSDCEPGHYCLSGIRWPCAPGTYSSRHRETMTACEWPCSAGYYCPAASDRHDMIPCGSAAFYCPEGSPVPIRVPDGFYSDPSVAAPSVRFSVLVCPPGSWCKHGVRSDCLPGHYGSSLALSAPECDGICAPGYFCLSGSPSMFQYPCGNVTVYCPRGSPWPKLVHSGFYGSTSGVAAGGQALTNTLNSTNSVELPCEPGYFCTGGLKHPCPPGTYGWRYGLNTSACSGQCAKGYYCPSYLEPQPEAPIHTEWPRTPQTAANMYECGNVRHYCPAGSSYPKRVLGGHYTTGGNTDNRTRTAQVICEPGSYCIDGIALHCPFGRYGNVSGLSNEQCSGLCPSAFYCPQHTANPVPCPPYHYSTNGAWVCSPCPGNVAVESSGLLSSVNMATLLGRLPCQDSRTCCFRAREVYVTD